MHVTGGKTWSFFYSNSANWSGAEAFGLRSTRARESLVSERPFPRRARRFPPVSLRPLPSRACFETPREQEKRFELASAHLSREQPWRTGCAKDIPPLTGDEVRVRTGRRMFGGKGVVQAAGEPVIGRRSCCVKLIESERIEPVFLFKYLSINYLSYFASFYTETSVF